MVGKLVCTALVVLLAIASPGAGARGGVSWDNDVCKLKVGPYLMHFTGFQPESTAQKEFREDIPSTGKTIIVLDYQDLPLRDLPVDIRIIRSSGTAATNRISRRSLPTTGPRSCTPLGRSERASPGMLKQAKNMSRLVDALGRRRQRRGRAL